MLFWLGLGALLLGSAAGTVYFTTARREARPDQYARYIYGCATVYGLLPITTGDWRWSLFAVPAALIVGSVIIARRR